MVSVLERALRDIDEIYEYIRKDNEDAAKKVYYEIRTAVSDLCAYPFKGGAVDKNDKTLSGYRFVMIKPYLIFYKVHGNEITVYRVIDGKRDYLNILM